jgi:SOS-response transcriptional repressor LexA
MIGTAKNEYTLLVDDDRMAPAAYAGQMVWIHPDEPLMPGRLVVVKLRSGQTIIRRFVVHDRGDDKIGLETLQPKPQVWLVNRDIVESVHRVVAVGDPWPEHATARPKRPPAG